MKNEESKEISRKNKCIFIIKFWAAATFCKKRKTFSLFLFLMSEREALRVESQRVSDTRDCPFDGRTLKNGFGWSNVEAYVSLLPHSRSIDLKCEKRERKKKRGKREKKNIKQIFARDKSCARVFFICLCLCIPLMPHIFNPTATEQQQRQQPFFTFF